MSVTCEICGKVFKTTQGRRGHKTFVHGDYNSDPEDSVTQSTIEQQLTTLKDQVEQLASKISILPELSNRLKKQDDILDQVGVFIYRNRDTLSGTEYKHVLDGISKLKEQLEKLSRYIQYEYAGISDDIVWSFILERPTLKKRLYTRVPRKLKLNTNETMIRRSTNIL